jgi:hypothetical protein
MKKYISNRKIKAPKPVANMLVPKFKKTKPLILTAEVYDVELFSFEHA